MANIKIYKRRPMQFCAISNRFRDINVSKLLTLKKLVKVTEYNFRTDAIRWQISKSINIDFFNIFYFRQSTTCANNSNGQTHRQTQ